MLDMRFACLQFDPKLGHIADNQARADALLDQSIHRGDIDVLLMPEMAFTGYCFTGREEIFPYCEKGAEGPTSRWCAATARRLGCLVVCGFPEQTGIGPLYNSLLVMHPEGRLLHVVRKHFLYTTDETWASEGPGFEQADLPGLGPCAFAICMDLNPRKFEAPADRFEFASSLFVPPLAHHEKPGKKHRLAANTVLCCNNWLRPAADTEIPRDVYSRYLMNYWAHRMSPVLGQPVVMAIANRTGVERGVRFAGTSCVLDLGRREILASLDETSEGVLLCE